MNKKNDILIRMDHLKKYFPVKGVHGPGIQTVEGVPLFTHRDGTLSLVGESGRGKTTLGRTIPQLHTSTSGRIEYGGGAIFEGQDPQSAGEDGEEQHIKVLKRRQVNMLPYRRKMQIIFQGPSTSLGSHMTTGEIIDEALDIHKFCSPKAERIDRIKELLGMVGLNTEYANRYPYEFSGGQQQRVSIARALIVKPEFIVHSEPISALDISVQSQVVNMLEDMQQEPGSTYLFIAHDLSVACHISSRIGIIYLGSLVELTESYEPNKNPLHPYTRTLLPTIPVPGPEISRQYQRIVLEDDIPSPMYSPKDRRFHTRCPYATDECKEVVPEFKEHASGHWIAYYLLGQARFRHSGFAGGGGKSPPYVTAGFDSLRRMEGVSHRRRVSRRN